MALALQEVDRLGALDRSVLLLVSPTGTGYVNYAAVEAVEYLAPRRRRHRDDAVLAATLVPVPGPGPRRPGAEPRPVGGPARADPGALPAESRPRVLMFGESLGAHTSQDAVLHEGTDGLADLGVDRALWIGSPFGSGWRTEVLGPDASADVTRTLVGEFDSFERVPGPRRRAARRAALRDDHPRRGRGAQVRATPGRPGPRLAACAAADRTGSRRPCAGHRSPPSCRCSSTCSTAPTSPPAPSPRSATTTAPTCWTSPAPSTHCLPHRPRWTGSRQALPYFEKALFDFIDGMKQVETES